MVRLANSIQELAGGYAVSKAVKVAQEYSTPLLLYPEAVFLDPLSRKQWRLVVYALDADEAYVAKQRMEPTAEKWLYTDCMYLIMPNGSVRKVRQYHSDAVDP